MDLGHRIVAMVGGAPKRVVCQTCGSEHNYRAPRSNAGSAVFVRNRTRQEEAPPRTAAQRVSHKARAEKERYDGWATRTLGKAVDAFTRYSMDHTFREGELVVHTKFGEGYVERVLDGSKVSVMFRDGARTLAHRGG
jgi:hypothetical protein